MRSSRTVSGEAAFEQRSAAAEEMSTGSVQGKGDPDSGNSKGKGPEVGALLQYLIQNKGGRVAG